MSLLLLLPGASSGVVIPPPEPEPEVLSAHPLVRVYEPKEILTELDLLALPPTLRAKLLVAGPFAITLSLQSDIPSVDVRQRVTEPKTLRLRSTEDAQIVASLVDDEAYHPLVDE